MHNIFSYKRGVAALGLSTIERSIWRRQTRKQPPSRQNAQPYVNPYAQQDVCPLPTAGPMSARGELDAHAGVALEGRRGVADPINMRVELDSMPQAFSLADMEQAAHAGDNSTLTAVYSMQCRPHAGDRLEAELIAIEDLALPANFVCPDTFVLRMHSNDMAPAMPQGAYLGVNRADTRPLPGVFVLKGEHPGLLVRRIFMDYHTKSFILRPDNDKSPASRASAEEVVERIVGRVIWVIKEIV